MTLGSSAMDLVPLGAGPPSTHSEFPSLNAQQSLHPLEDNVSIITWKESPAGRTDASVYGLLVSRVATVDPEESSFVIWFSCLAALSARKPLQPSDRLHSFACILRI